MSMKDFIQEAHTHPRDYIAYHVGRELAELHPGKTILHGQTGSFDLDAFVRAGNCSVVAHKSIFQNSKTIWEGAGIKQTDQIQNAWLNVLWRGELFDVVLLTWVDGCYHFRHHWIVTEDQKTAEEFFDAVCTWSCDVREEIVIYNGFFEKDPKLFASIKSATFENLVLPESLKQQIQDDFKRFFDSREVYERYGIPWRRGALFIGPPGNGKTHTLKALINQLGKPCIYVRTIDDDDELGEVFDRARMVAPCVLVFEDLDAMIRENRRSLFLNELDGFRANTGVVVLATTNHPEKLDTAILDRPSRFDRKYYFQLPAEAERRTYLGIWNAELQPEMRVNAETTAELARVTKDFSFAYLKELCVSSMLEWMSVGGKMDQLILAQAKLLRGQVKTKTE